MSDPDTIEIHRERLGAIFRAGLQDGPEYVMITFATAAAHPAWPWPSINTIAQSLGVSKNTVQGWCDQLESIGVIRRAPGRIVVLWHLIDPWTWTWGPYSPEERKRRWWVIYCLPLPSDIRCFLNLMMAHEGLPDVMFPSDETIARDADMSIETFRQIYRDMEANGFIRRVGARTVVCWSILEQAAGPKGREPQ